MNRTLILAGALFATAAAGLCSSKQPRPQQLQKANALPLALDDSFQFRKTEILLADPLYYKPTTEQMISTERQRVDFKAVTQLDRRERRGEYFTFFWRASRKADVTVRFEYRQEFLGPYVQAREVAFTGAKGTMRTQFQIVGDDYFDEGRVTSWRAVIIEDGKIVGLTQSFLWH
jgi:hypothetical protein